MVGARRVKIRRQPPPWMSRRHHSSSCGVGARAGGWHRDAPPHPFKVKLGDHFSAAPEITPGWGVGPGMWNTRDTPPLPERISWVATSIYHLGHHSNLGRQPSRIPNETSRWHQPGNSPAKHENTKLKDRQITMQSLISPATSFV